MQTVTVEEYEKLAIGDRPGQLPRHVADALLSGWSARTGTEPASYFEFGGGWIKPKGWTGVVPGETTLEVLPKGARSLVGEDRQRLDRNLGQMFGLALGGDGLSLEKAQLSSAGTTYDRAAEALADAVLRARRQQKIRSYVQRHDETHSTRGRLRFPRQLLVSLRRPGSFASEWLELTDDTPVNQFVSAVLATIGVRVHGRVRRRVDEALVELEGASRIDANLAYARIDQARLPHNYRDLVRLAKAIHDGELPGLYSGSRDANAGLILLPTLFDAFVSRISIEAARAVGRAGAAKVRGRYLAVWESGLYAGSELIEVVPDAEIHDQGRAELVIDAKWKRLELARPSLNVEAGDIYQMLSYGRRLGCSRAMLVYPSMSRYPAPELIGIRVGTSPSMRVDIVQLPLLWGDLREPLHHLTSAILA